MQMGYDHCLPKMNEFDQRRSVLIFRHGSGDATTVKRDTGYALTDVKKRSIKDCGTAGNGKGDGIGMGDENAPGDENVKEEEHKDILVKPPRPPQVKFGHPSSDILEGKASYTRAILFNTGAHR